jgi:hypothetical protein
MLSIFEVSIVLYFTDFNEFFTGIYFFLPISKISLTCKLSIGNNFVGDFVFLTDANE